MKSLLMLILLLGSMAAFANTADPYADCTQKLEHRILKAANRHCLFGLRCEVIVRTLELENIMAEEQDPGQVWYLSRVTTVHGVYADSKHMFFKMKALRSSEADGEHFFCDLKTLKRISKKAYDKNHTENL